MLNDQTPPQKTAGWSGSHLLRILPGALSNPSPQVSQFLIHRSRFPAISTRPSVSVATDVGSLSRPQPRSWRRRKSIEPVHTTPHEIMLTVLGPVRIWLSYLSILPTSTSLPS